MRTSARNEEGGRLRGMSRCLWRALRTIGFTTANGRALTFACPANITARYFLAKRTQRSYNIIYFNNLSHILPTRCSRALVRATPARLLIEAVERRPAPTCRLARRPQLGDDGRDRAPPLGLEHRMESGCNAAARCDLHSSSPMAGQRRTPLVTPAVSATRRAVGGRILAQLHHLLAQARPAVFITPSQV